MIAVKQTSNLFYPKMITGKEFYRFNLFRGIQFFELYVNAQEI